MQDAFPAVPTRYLAGKLREHGHLYPAFLAIAEIERKYDGSIDQPYSKLKYGRHNTGANADQMISNFGSGDKQSYQSLLNEIKAAQERRARDDR